MKPELKKLLVLNLPYLLFVYLFAKCGQAYRLAAGADASAKLLHLTGGISAAFANPLPSLHPFDLCVGVVGAVAVRLIVYSKPNYTEVYAAPLTAGTTLEDIYRTFNVDHPADFKGHSLSVSDVVVLHQNGQDTAHYCDSVGFQQVPEFLRENPLRTAELSTEQNENMIDGVLNNAPSLGELEAKAKAGEQISLTDLAAAVKAEEKAPKAKKSRTAKPKKPSIRAQLDAAKKEQSKQPPPREKTKELEV